MKQVAARYASQLLALVAVAFVSVASPWAVHRPKAPKELLK
ncbi:cyclic lactone autoinducer peptide [Paenibacillus sp. HJGM_3]